MHYCGRGGDIDFTIRTGQTLYDAWVQMKISFEASLLEGGEGPDSRNWMDGQIELY